MARLDKRERVPWQFEFWIHLSLTKTRSCIPVLFLSFISEEWIEKRYKVQAPIFEERKKVMKSDFFRIPFTTRCASSRNLPSYYLRNKEFYKLFFRNIFISSSIICFLFHDLLSLNRDFYIAHASMSLIMKSSWIVILFLAKRSN